MNNYYGAYLDNCWSQEQAGFPQAKATLAGLSNEDLDREHFIYLRASFDRMFGMNAKKMLELVESEIAARL